MVTAMPGSTFSESLTLGTTGLVGTLAIQVVDAGQQTVAVARTTVGVVEFPAGSGVYGVNLVAPLAPGSYALIWDTAGANPLTPENSYYDTLTVIITDPQFADGWSFDPVTGWSQDDENEDELGDSGVNISTGVVGSNPIPSAADVIAASKLDWCNYGWDPTGTAGIAGIQELVDRAESSFWRITGQTINEIAVIDQPLVRRCIQGMTEQMAMEGASDTLDTLSDFDLIQTFNAGGYSETRRDPGEAFKARLLNPIPWISDALWTMLSPDRYDFWVMYFTGTHAPAWQADDVYWEAGQTVANLYGPSPGHFWGA